MHAHALLVEPRDWTYLVFVLDWYTNKIVSHDTGRQTKSTHWVLTPEQATQHQCPAGCHGRASH